MRLARRPIAPRARGRMRNSNQRPLSMWRLGLFSCVYRPLCQARCKITNVAAQQGLLTKKHSAQFVQIEYKILSRGCWSRTRCSASCCWFCIRHSLPVVTFVRDLKPLLRKPDFLLAYKVSKEFELRLLCLFVRSWQGDVNTQGNPPRSEIYALKIVDPIRQDNHAFAFLQDFRTII